MAEREDSSEINADNDQENISDIQQELASSLQPVREKLDQTEGALKEFDDRAKDICEQRAALIAAIHKEIDEQHRLLDQRRAELLGELKEQSQQKLQSLESQRDQVEIDQMKLTSCLKYAEGGLFQGTEGELLAMKAFAKERVQQITEHFTEDNLIPETEADLELVLDKKLELQQNIQDFLMVAESRSLSLHNSKVDTNALKDPTVGRKLKVIFEAFNDQGEPFRGSIDLQGELSYNDEENTNTCGVKKESGRYHISFIPLRRGHYKLFITANSKPIQGSPFKIVIPTTPLCFHTPIRVITGLTMPRGIATNSKGNLIVVDTNGTSVSLLAPNGDKILSFCSTLNNENIIDGFGVAVDHEDNIYIVSNVNHCIHKFNSEGAYIDTVGSYGSGNLEFSYPKGITYNSTDKHLYIADQANNRVQVLTTELAFVRAFGRKGTENGEFKYPRAVAFDSVNNTYVTDYHNHKIQVLTPTGQFLRDFSLKANNQKLNGPWAIAIDSDDMVYVSEDGPKCVNVFTSQGEYITSFQNGITCRGLATDRYDMLFVSDHYQGSLVQY